MKGAWVRLGAGDAAGAGLGSKAALLDIAQARGLPVPPGVVVPDDTRARLVGAGVITESGDAVSAPDAALLALALRLPALGDRVAVRSAFASEDGRSASQAGLFTTVLDVDPGDATALASAFERVWSSASRHGAWPARRDVLVMTMVPARMAGVAFTEPEHEDDLVNATPGRGDALVGGHTAGTRWTIPKLRRGERSREAGWAARLQALLRDVRRVFGAETGWDVEWADDGERVWLLQVRPVTRPTVRDELFTFANHREILPDLPSVFMSSLIASCADDLFEYYRRFDRRLPATRPFIEIVLGRPLINLSLLMDMMRTWGLPTRLVTDSIGGAADRDVPLQPRRVLAAWRPLSRLARAQVGAVRSARRLGTQLRRRTRLRAAGFGGAIEELRWVYTALVQEMFGLTAAMSLPMALLRRLGTLEEHACRERTVTSALYEALDELRALALKSPGATDALRRGEMPVSPEFEAAWRAFVREFGARGVYESDIARPRGSEDPAALLRALALPSPARPARPKRSARGVLTWPLWWLARRALLARERLRHDAMSGFANMRAELRRMAKLAVAAKQLPDADALWLLEIDEVRALDARFVADESLLARRRRERERLAAIALADVVHRSGKPYEGTFRAPARDGALVGLPLTSGSAQGVAWVLDEPASVLPPGFAPHETILVASAVDAGWAASFGLVAAVVVETGGDLSHGSILLREIGIPAVTNVNGVRARVRTGDVIALDARAGRVEIVSSRAGENVQAGSH